MLKKADSESRLIAKEMNHMQRQMWVLTTTAFTFFVATAMIIIQHSRIGFEITLWGSICCGGMTILFGLLALDSRDQIREINNRIDWPITPRFGPKQPRTSEVEAHAHVEAQS